MPGSSNVPTFQSSKFIHLGGKVKDMLLNSHKDNGECFGENEWKFPLKINYHVWFLY